MHPLDLIVLLGTLGFIVLYGIYKSRGKKNMDAYLRSSGEKKWWAICLSIMATQASAITFLSTPGQAYESGMGFLQIYFGLPLAMIVISAVFIPIFYKQNVYTAYEYLENRFNVQTRQFIAFLFLVSRGLGAGHYHLCTCDNSLHNTGFQPEPYVPADWAGSYHLCL